MITAEIFLSKWDKEICPLVSYKEKYIKKLGLSNEVKSFLIEAGLPEAAAPYLNFEASAQGGAIAVGKKYKELKKKKGYIYLGYTGNGDIICAVEKTGNVIVISHENKDDEQFVNSSILQLIECLVEYDEFVNKIMAANGRRAFLESNATDELLEWIRERIATIDNIALDKDCFWRNELERYMS